MALLGTFDNSLRPLSAITLPDPPSHLVKELILPKGIEDKAFLLL